MQLSAMDMAVAQIKAEFGWAASHDLFKRTVRSYMRLDPYHSAVRAQYGARLDMLRGFDLDGAIILVERAFCDERKAFQISSLVGAPRCRLSLNVLRELRLLLRFSRRYDPAAYYAAHLAFLCEAAE